MEGVPQRLAPVWRWGGGGVWNTALENIKYSCFWFGALPIQRLTQLQEHKQVSCTASEMIITSPLPECHCYTHSSTLALWDALHTAPRTSSRQIYRAGKRKERRFQTCALYVCTAYACGCLSFRVKWVKKGVSRANYVRAVVSVTAFLMCEGSLWIIHVVVLLQSTTYKPLTTWAPVDNWLYSMPHSSIILCDVMTRSHASNVVVLYKMTIHKWYL